MRVVFGVVIGLAVGIAATFVVLQKRQGILSPIITAVARPLDRYTIPALSGSTFLPSTIHFGEITATTSAYTVRAFSFYADSPEGKPDPKLLVTGVAHIPDSPKPANGYPVIIQFRGYVDPKIYFPGEGTQHSAEAFASNGFLSLAPDFLDYGGSSKGSNDVFEDRFQTYTPGPITKLSCDQMYYNPKNGYPEYYLSAQGGDLSNAQNVTCEFTATVKTATIASVTVKSPLTPAPERNGSTFRCTTGTVRLTPSVPTKVDVVLTDDLGKTSTCSSMFTFPAP